MARASKVTADGLVPEAKAAPSTTHKITVNTIAVIFALGFAYLIFNAINYTITINQTRQLDGIEWTALGLSIALPLLIALLAYSLTRAKSVLAFLLIQATGLALAAAYWLNVVGYLGWQR